ncbi:hypothetical protein D3C71_779130 [compost metagenome]
MDLDLFGFEPGDFPGDHLVQGLELGAGPDFAFVLGDAHRAVQWLHRRVCQVRHAVFNVDFLGRFRQRSLGIPRLACVQAGGGGEFAEVLQQRLAVEPGVRPRIPLDFQRIAPQLRRPKMIGNHRDAGRHLHHFVHTRNRQRFGAFKGFDAAAEGGRTGDHRSHQPVKLHVHAELRPAGDFFRSVQTLGGFADQLPVLCVLEFDRGRVWPWQLPGVIGQFAVGGTVLTGHDHPRFGMNLGRRDVETLGRCVDQHQARRRAGLAIAVELHPGRGRAAGDLHPAKTRQAVIGGRSRCMLDADFRPVGVQFFGDQHGQAGPDALAHFRVPQQYGDTVVVANTQEGIGRKHVALVFRAHGETVGTGHGKRDHQPAAQHGTALEKTTTR